MMRTFILAAVIVIMPIAAAAQAGPTAAVVRQAQANQPAMRVDGGGPGSATERAQQFLNAIRAACVLVENDGKLFAACDNTTAAARNRGTPSSLPQITTEWEAFATRLLEADQVVNGKRRPIVVLNNGVVVVEATSGGVVTLKK